MTIIAKPGYMVDPNNPNGVIRADSYVAPPAQTTLAQDMAKTANQGKSGYDVFGNPVAGSSSSPTVGSIYAGVGVDPNLTAGYNAQIEGAKTAGNQVIDENAIRASTLASFQAEIDAQNALFADKLAAAKVTGANRIGSGTAISARRGLIGSDFGTAQANNIEDANQGVYDSIENEKMAAIASIMTKARTAANEAIKEKTAAKQAGLDSYVKYLSEAATRKETNAQKAAETIINSGYTLEKLGENDLNTILSGYGISATDLKASYKSLVDAKNAAKKKAELDSQFVLSKGQQRYDSSGKLIAEGTKNLPPSAQEYEYAVANGYKGSYDQYQTDDTNRKIVIAKAGSNSSGLSPYQVFQATQSLKKNVQTTTAASSELKRQANIINETFNRFDRGEATDLNGTTQAIVTVFNKLLDPTSVVREAEYDRSASGQALLTSIQGKIAALAQGGPGLTYKSLKELVDLGNIYAKNAQASIDATNARAREEAQFFGLNPDFVTTAGSNPTTEGTVDPEEQALMDQGYLPEQIQAIKNAK